MGIKNKFPSDFEWGSSVWAQGTEGAAFKDGKASTVWDESYRRNPKRFYNEVGPNETLNWYEDYQTYADLAQDIDLQSFRTSILWARLLPDGKHVNEEALTFYRKMFHAFKKNHMKLSVVLYWFDMPLRYEDQGGFTNRDILPDFIHYAKTCFSLFDDVVDIWYVYNEPIIDVCFKYQDAMCYPYATDYNLAMNAIYNMSIAHASVVQEFKKGTYTAQIGSVLNRSRAYPRSNDIKDVKASQMLEMFYFECFEYPLLKGILHPEWLETARSYGAVLDFRDGDQRLLSANTISLLGINIYSCDRVKAPEIEILPNTKINFGFDNRMFFAPYALPTAKMNKDRGWEIYPEVVYDVLMKMKQDYGNPLMYITENGMGVQQEHQFKDEQGEIQDDYRIEYVELHAQSALRAIHDGANLKGYSMWSFVDLWSPTNQFKNCYGFYEYDLKTKVVRKKKSAHWIKKVIKQHGF